MTDQSKQVSAQIQDGTFESQYVDDQRPALLSYVAAAAGYTPPDPSAAFTYLELGCGSGRTLNALAASSPHATFIGIDFINNAVAQARAQAKNAQLDNVSYHVIDVQEFQQLDLPQFDYITISGAYYWLDAAAEKTVHALVDSHLKDGGIFFFDYLVMPGKASMAPVWHLMRDRTEGRYESPAERASAGLRFLWSLAGEDAKYISDNPQVQEVLNFWDLQLRTDSSNARHLARATLVDQVAPKYSSDVVEALVPLGLQFAGVTTLSMNDPELALPAELRPGGALELDPVQLELVKDFYHYTQQRHDVFIRTSEIPDVDNALLSTPLHMAFLWPQKAPQLSFNDPTDQPVETDMKMVEQISGLALRGKTSIFDIAAQLRSEGSAPDDISLTIKRMLTFPGLDVFAQAPLRGGGTAVTGVVAANRYNELAVETLKKHGGNLYLACDRTGGCIQIPALPSTIVAGFVGRKTADVTLESTLSFVRSIPGTYAAGDGKEISGREVTGQMIAPALGLVIKVILPGLIALGALKPV